MRSLCHVFNEDSSLLIVDGTEQLLVISISKEIS